MHQLDDVSDEGAGRLGLSSEDLPSTNEDSITVQAELSSALEESVESLSAAVGGWRSELARSSERSSRLEATIASLSASMETWKTDMARSSARGEERMLRALEILESRMAQHQAVSNEIRDSLGTSAAWLTRAMEEWKAEIRYGSGLTEVRLLSAIEALEGRVAQVEDSEIRTREELGSAAAEIALSLEARVDTVKAVQDETREWLEAAATAVGNDAQTALGRLRDLGSSLDALRGQMRHDFADSLVSTNESKAAVIGRVNDVVSILSAAESATAAERSNLRSELTGIRETLSTLKEDVLKSVTGGLAEVRTAGTEAISTLRTSVEEWKGAVEESAKKTAERMVRALEALDQSVGQSREMSSQIRDQITTFSTGISEQLAQSRDQITTFSTGISEQLAQARDAGTQTRDRIDAVGTEITAKLAETNRSVDGVPARAGELIAKGIQDLEQKILGQVEALGVTAGESRSSLEGVLTSLRSSLTEWQEQLRKAASTTEGKMIGALETLEKRISDTGEGRQESEHQLLSRLEEVEQKLARAREDGESRQDQLESSLKSLVETIDAWRNQGRVAATKNRERLSLSLEALESRILETRDEEESHRVALFKELDALADAIDSLDTGGRDYARVMRGLEELDASLLRNRDDVAKLTETFEAQFETFESRVTSLVKTQMDELERSMQERMKAFVTLTLGPSADTSALTGVPAASAPRRPATEPLKTDIDSQTGQPRRRRR